MGVEPEFGIWNLSFGI